MVQTNTQTNTQANTQANTPTLKVDPVNGKDAGAASAGPFKTLTAALKQAQPGTVIQLAAGTYSHTSGETFPLVVGRGIRVVGNEANRGQGVTLQGSGSFHSELLGDLSVGLVLREDAEVRGVTLMNPQGNGIYIDSGRATLKASQILQCARHGLMVAGKAMPTVVDSQFEGMGGSGLHFSQQGKGEVRRCQVKRCDVAIAVRDEAAPLIIETQCLNSRVGLGTFGKSHAVLRSTQLLQNQEVGLWLQDTSWSDIGQAQDPGGNRFRYNIQADLRNDTGRPVVSVGNDLLPQRLVGSVSLMASQVPEAVAVPPRLMGTGQGISPGTGQPSSSVTAAEQRPGAAEPSVLPPPTTGSTPSPFTDMADHWAAPYVNALAQRGLVKGLADGSFLPNRAVTRAEFAALVAASFPAVPDTKPAVSFVDVPNSFWAQAVIARVQQQGFLSGYPDQTFRPNETITRVQAIVAIAHGLALPAAAANVLSVYQDRAQIPSYAVDTLAAATQNRLVVNYPDRQRLRPMEAMTRAEVATLVYQGLTYQGKAPILDSPYLVKESTTPSGFPDLAGHWAEPFIQALASHHLITGLENGQFQPDGPMTRAQYAALLMKAFQPQPKHPPVSFVDVPPNFWAAEAIQAACRGGFMSGFPDHTFAPDHPLLRVQSWVSLVNGLALLAGQPGNQALLNRFSDRATIPSYALDGVAKATQLGLVVNVPELSRLNPNRVASRADIAAVVYQALVAQQRMPEIPCPYIVQNIAPR